MNMRQAEANEGDSPRAQVHGHPRTFRQSLYAMLGLSTVVMMVAIDQTVVGTALPSIIADLKDYHLYAWVATAYLLASLITVPIFGGLGDRYGRKPLIVVAIVLFSAASALCGMSASMFQLVVFRALQGVGGGMLVGTCFASIPDLFPDPVVRLRWQVLFSSAFGVANAVGPSLGGWLSQHYGWRYAFYVNVPVGIASLYFTAAHLPHVRYPRSGKLALDWQGALLIALTLGGAQALVESLGHAGAAWRPLALAGAVALAVALLVRVERRALQPLLPRAVLGDRAIVVLLLLSLLMGMAMFSLLLYVPLLLQVGFGMGAEQAGITITPLVACITIGTVLNTRIVTRLRNPNRLLYAGFALLAISCGSIAFAATHMRHTALVGAMLAGGVGIGLVMPNLTVFAQQVAGKLHLGIATAMIQSARMVGGMIGTAVSGAAIAALYRVDLAHAVAAARIPPGPWDALLRSPEPLLRGASMVPAAAPVVALARTSLRHAVSGTLFGMLVMMIGACALVFALPLIRIKSFDDAKRAH